MKTTVEIPDRLYRCLKARAALRGQTIKEFLVDAVREKLAGESESSAGKSGVKKGWRAAFGTARAEDVAQVQRIIDDEFSKIDSEGWE